jgi:hypothetical protein
MTTYSWKIQFSEHYTDEFNHKGAIDKDRAIEEFQFFPWDKEIDDYKRSNDNPTIPKIIFDADDKRQLTISSTSNRGYQIKYINFASEKYSDFYVSSNFEKKNYTPEEIIEFFFENNLEEHLKLKSIPKASVKKPIEKKNPKNTEFSFKHTFRPLFTLNFFIWLAVSVGYAVISAKESTFPKWVLVIFVFTWPIPLIVHLTYYMKNAGAKVIIDTRNHDLTFVKGTKEIKFNRDDIFRCQITYSKSSRMSLCDDYSYVWFILNDRRYVVITHFIADPYEIVETLNCKFEERSSGAFLPIF